MAANGCSSSAWPTPVANDDQKSPEAHLAMKARMKGGPRQTVTSLTVMSKMWPTPATRDHKGANSADHLERSTGSKHLDQLPNFVAHLWYTPNVPNGGRTLSEDTSPTGMTAGGIKRQVGLENQARLWATQAQDFSRSRPSLPVPATSPNGQKSSSARRVLNPRFVEWLMGWPTGWTSFACSATALSRFKRRMRSELLSLGLPGEAAPAQLSLLG